MSANFANIREFINVFIREFCECPRNYLFIYLSANFANLREVINVFREVINVFIQILL